MARVLRAGVELLGRRAEQEALAQVLRDIAAGRSRVLVLRGDLGVGKTALLNHLADQATGGRVVRAGGVEQESEIAYSALQHLCAPLMGYLDRLPEAHRGALATAFGLSAGAPPELLMLGIAVLGLFAEAAADRPLVCLVDDVQWLDRPSAMLLAFVARRLDAESVAMVLAVDSGEPPEGEARPGDPPEGEARPGEPQMLAGLPEMAVGGLPDAAARALLDSVLAGPVDARVRDRIVAETGGNALALLELTRELSAAELAFGFGGSGAAPLAGRVERGFQRRLAALPAATRTLLLTAAVEPIGDAPLLWRALERLGIGADAAEPAVAARLIELGTQVRFRHPLVRSAGRRSADPAELRAVHAALAAVTDPVRDPDRRAWHRAHAAVGPDEEVAAELEATADRAVTRGGRSAAAAFFERAAALTPDLHRRAGRALAAARERLYAGTPSLVPGLLAAAELGPLDPLQRAEADRLRAAVSFVLTSVRGTSSAILTAAEQLATADPRAARGAYLSAIGHAVHAGRLGPPDQLRRAAEAARHRPKATPTTHQPAGDDAYALFLDGMTAWALDGYAAAVPKLSRALHELTDDEDMELIWLAALVAMELFDDESWWRISAQAVDFARRTGYLYILPAALSYRSGVLLFAGRFAEAADLLAESAAAGEMGRVTTYYATGIILAAHQGREDEALRRIAAAERDAQEAGVGRIAGIAMYAKAALYNGLGDFPAALASARDFVSYPELSGHAWGLVEMAEAAARTGESALVTEARDRLAQRTSVAGTPFALGSQAVADALAAGEPEPHFQEAIRLLGRSRQALRQARARLLYGEWLRRANRRAAARAELHAAYEAFTTFGAEAFAERARRELAATGEVLRQRAVGDREELTAQETQIARLAVEGRTNPEIAAALFLSPRTVEWHLRKVFTKLGVSSRRDLGEHLRGR
ncbi:ATP-binding protein [Actinoplanes sp. CA-054009]